MIYELRAEFITARGTECSSVLFECDGPEDAALAAWKYVRNRQKLRELFGGLRGLKVSEYHIGKPEPGGFISSGPNINGYEWRANWGTPPMIPDDPS